MHENLPTVSIDSQGRYVNEYKKPPFRYIVSYEYEGNLYTQMVLANDELDAVIEFNKEK